MPGKRDRVVEHYRPVKGCPDEWRRWPISWIRASVRVSGHPPMLTFRTRGDGMELRAAGDLRLWKAKRASVSIVTR